MYGTIVVLAVLLIYFGIYLICRTNKHQCLGKVLIILSLLALYLIAIYSVSIFRNEYLEMHRWLWKW